MKKVHIVLEKRHDKGINLPSDVLIIESGVLSTIINLGEKVDYENKN